MKIYKYLTLSIAITTISISSFAATSTYSLKKTDESIHDAANLAKLLGVFTNPNLKIPVNSTGDRFTKYDRLKEYINPDSTLPGSSQDEKPHEIIEHYDLYVKTSSPKNIKVKDGIIKKFKDYMKSKEYDKNSFSEFMRKENSLYKTDYIQLVAESHDPELTPSIKNILYEAALNINKNNTN